MTKIINLYTHLEKKQALIKPTTTLYSDRVMTERGQEIMNFVQMNGIITTEMNGATVKLEVGKAVVGPEFQCILLGDEKTTQTYSVVGEDFIIIGGRNTHHIELKDIRENSKFLLERKDKLLYLHPDEIYPIYVNNIAMRDVVKLEPGDVLDISGVEIIIRSNTIEIIDGVHGLKNVSLIPVETEQGLRMSDDKYKRSPRLIYPEPTDEVILATPPTEPTRSTESILRIIIPPLSMVGVTILTSIFMNRGPYVYIMLVTTFVTLVMSITSYIKQRKEHKEKLKTRIESYTRYLNRKLAELSERVAEQAQSRHYHYPENHTILKMAENANSRMWEKTAFHHDFLEVRIGSAKIPLSFKVNLNEQDYTEKEDELMEEAKTIRDRFQGSNHLPRTLNLNSGAVGLLGNPTLMREQITLLLNQIAFFHSYNEVEIVHVYSEEDREYWSQFDFLPQVNSKMLHARTNIFSERTRDQVLTGFFQVLKGRQQEFDEKKSGGNDLTFAPHFVLIISDMRQIIDHSIMEYLSKDVTHLGVSVIYVDRTLKNLPEHVKTVVEYRNDHEGKIIIEDGELVQDRIELDHLPNDFPLEKIPRILAGYEHVQTLKSSIPEKVGFLEMYGVSTVEDLKMEARWQNGNPGKTLAVPLGYRGPGDIVNLNLHEKAHGPHGLVAGTTGSGKSEIVQSYILSLATNFHPYDVGFLLIDYKGGGMANLFKDLPHLLGTITNLDGSQSMRALTAIKAELLHRQQLFSDNDVNHIDGYQKLFKEGKVTEPMPHLFMISDEFAELKAEQPEFMKELVSTARIGRSLGIHLILATQKPSGVVDDQIWSNSKFKLCLKVQNASDSNEMLKTPDAAAITQPGRAYLQVGNNEIYELFQSAYSGAPYMAGIEIEDVRDNRIYEINELGQYELKTQDLSRGNVGKITMLELDAIVEEVQKTFAKTGLEAVPSPWLEPLAEFIPQDEYESVNVEKEWAKFEQNQVVEQLEMIVGVTDEPQNQAQNALKMNLSNGHIGVFGAGGFGKTTMIQTMIMSLVRKNTPEAMHFYILDFGQGLLPLRNLPHVADLITLDEEEKLGKWVRLMTEQLTKRKRKFKEAGVADIETYRQLTGEKLERIVIVIDNFDAMRDEGFNEGFDKVVNTLTREGLNLGIHIIIGAMRSNSIRYQLMANIKEKMTFFQIDSTEIPSIMGRTQMKIQEIPGRGIIKLDDFYEFQALVPNSEESQGTRIAELRKEVDQMRGLWNGDIPKEIPIVPEVLTIGNMKNRVQMDKLIESKNHIVVGLDVESVQPVAINVETDYISIGAADEQLLNIVQTVCETAGNNMNITIIDTPQGYLHPLRNYGTYSNEIEESNEHIGKLYYQVEKYNETLAERRQTEPELTMPILLQDEKRELVILNDVDSYSERTKDDYRDQVVANMIKTYGVSGVSFVILSDITKFGYSPTAFKSVVSTPKYALITAKVGDTRLTVSQRTYGEPVIENGEANFVNNGKFAKIKLVDEFKGE